MINAVVAKALFDTQIETLDAFLAFLPEKYNDDVDMDFMKEAVEAFKEKLQTDYKPPRGAVKVLKELNDCTDSEDVSTSNGTKKTAKKTTKKVVKNDDDESVEEKKKRAPSAYTMFVKHKMTLLRMAHEGDMKGTNFMKIAAAAWKELTEDQQNEMKTNFKKFTDEYDGVQDEVEKQKIIAKMMYESVFPSDDESE